MMTSRSAGLLLHPTSLPGRFGIGDLGPEVEHFLGWAEAGGQSIWQILPLVPTGHHNSPYNGLSAFAGNPLLLSPELLLSDGLLGGGDLSGAPPLPAARVDFGRTISWKEALLRSSWRHFRGRPPRGMEEEFRSFAADSGRASWLEDWALFSALKSRLGGEAWTRWPSEIRRREPEAMAAARSDLQEEIAYHRYLQFLFSRQWGRVKEEAHRRGIRVMGDLPIYVALDSADVWANAHLFELDEEGRPRMVAGVPPDYFSATGQLWGNPLYRWDVMAEEGYAWWIARIRESLRQVDLLRIDHFRAFASYWEIPAGEKTAVNGTWRPGPGEAFFVSVRSALGELPLVAEDLGVITPEVRDLLRRVGAPGMKVLQFAFGDPDSDHLPGRFGSGTVVYTGTHDNDTTRGWFLGLEEEVRARTLEFLGTGGEEIHWDLIRAAYRSEADLAVVPVQDVLGLGSEARMNDPAKPAGNWGWRVRREQLRPEIAGRLGDLAEQTGRLVRRPPAGGGAGRPEPQ